MFTAKLGALFLAPLMAFSSYFGGGHTNASIQGIAHANDNSAVHAISSPWSKWENNWTNWFTNRDNDNDGDETGTTTGTTTPPVTATTTLSIATSSPDQGPVGTNVTLTGSGFTSDSKVHLGSSVVTDPTITSSTTIAFAVPSVKLGSHQLYVTNANGPSNKITFTVTKAPAPTPSPLSITGLSAPVVLKAGSSGTWTVHVAVPSSFTGNLNYSVKWGDEGSAQPLMAAAMIHTSGTFTHTYESAGTYKPVFTVRDDSGNAATTSAKVIVKAAS